MNDDTTDLLYDVVGRLERSIQARDCPAIVAMQGQRKLILSDYDYLRDQATAEAFEARAAVKAREIGATRWVLAVPQVWRITAGEISARAVSNHPLREDEQEAIAWTALTTRRAWTTAGSPTPAALTASRYSPSHRYSPSAFVLATSRPATGRYAS